jgi:hypothetical protein
MHISANRTSRSGSKISGSGSWNRQEDSGDREVLEYKLRKNKTEGSENQTMLEI